MWREASWRPWGSVLQCSLLRQAAEVALGYATALRGHDVAKLQLPDLTTERGLPAAHLLHLLQPGQQFCVRPYMVKIRQEANAGSITVTVRNDS